MKIYTKTGDKGQTGLIGGVRVSKGADRIESYGTVDELNSYIGLLGDLPINESRKDLLHEIQDRLFTIGSHLALAPEKESAKIPDLLEDDILLLETSIDTLSDNLTPMRYFILPGGSIEISYAHIARTVCRRAEREVVRLSEKEPVDQLIVRYLNRLSDYLFVLSRGIAYEQNMEEKPWRPRKNS